MSLKEIATDFLTLVVKGEAKKLLNYMFPLIFLHHNTWFPSDANSLLQAMETDATNNPKKSFEIFRALKDDHLVVIHSKVVLKNNLQEIAMAHFLK